MTDTPMSDGTPHNVGDLGMLCRKLERELIDAQHRIRTLIEERDSARIQADHKWKLREEFEALLGADDVAVGVDRIKQSKRELTEARTRIKELADVGGALADHLDLDDCRCDDCQQWRRAVKDWKETVKRCLEGIE